MNKPQEIWVVDDDQSIRWVLERALSQAGFDIRTFSSADEVLNIALHKMPDAIISDIRMPGTDGLTFMRHLKNKHPTVPIIIMTAHSDLDSAVASYKGGAFEYLPKPFDINDAVALAQRACNHQQYTVVEDLIADGLPEIIGEAPAMQEVFRAIGRLAQSNITVLINGESGTGKELVARALHRHSPRRDKPFIALNMAAIPRDLLESELFGHERGSFTGAQAQRQGRFEQANGGTLFLDEIGDMPAELQTRLLRVLSDGEFYRVGGQSPLKANVRIVAATHQNLEELVKNGQFREDLFHRINVIRIHIPALRERREDIPLLMRYFLREAAEELNVSGKTLQPQVEEWLKQQNWPGNVRQLQNLSRWLIVMASGRQIQISDLPADMLKKDNNNVDSDSSWEKSLREWAQYKLTQGKQNLLEEALPTFERTLIEIALTTTRGRKQDAARLLGWGRNTLTRKLKELNINI